MRGDPPTWFVCASGAPRTQDSQIKNRGSPGTLGCKVVHMLVAPNMGPRLHLLSFQGSQPGLQPGLGTAELRHHGLHLLPVLLAQRLHLPGPLGLLLLLQQPAAERSTDLPRRQEELPTLRTAGAASKGCTLGARRAQPQWKGSWTGRESSLSGQLSSSLRGHPGHTAPALC